MPVAPLPWIGTPLFWARSALVCLLRPVGYRSLAPLALATGTPFGLALRSLTVGRLHSTAKAIGLPQGWVSLLKRKRVQTATWP